LWKVNPRRFQSRDAKERRGSEGVEAGQKVRVDTRAGQYLERAD
jgi:hypothetical protein